MNWAVQKETSFEATLYQQSLFWTEIIYYLSSFFWLNFFPLHENPSILLTFRHIC